MTPRRFAILKEMGLTPVWRMRGSGDWALPDAPQVTEVAPVPQQAPPVRESHWAARQIMPQRPPEPVRVSTPAVSPTASDPARVAGISGMDWMALESAVAECDACVLCHQRRQAVVGVGDHKARWMFVGEGPGSEEDKRGEPFVGPSGQLLDKMLAALGLKRGEDVYIANTVKCRPPQNRTPSEEEIRTCLPFLERQIALVQPKILVALGLPAIQALLGRRVKLYAERGKRFERNGIPVVVTYHPSYLLRTPQDKGKAWEDLCFARRCLGDVTP